MYSCSFFRLPRGALTWRYPLCVLVYTNQAGRRGGGGLLRGGATQFVHGRSRMTIDPRIPVLPGRSTSGFHQPGRHCLHQVRSAVRCSASRIKGELHPSKNRSQDGLRLVVQFSLLMEGWEGGEGGSVLPRNEQLRPHVRGNSGDDHARGTKRLTRIPPRPQRSTQAERHVPRRMLGLQRRLVYCCSLRGTRYINTSTNE